MPEYVHQIKKPGWRRISMIPSVFFIAVLTIVMFVLSTIFGPTKIYTHANFGVAMFTNAIISMWTGRPHIQLTELSKKYYK